MGKKILFISGSLGLGHSGRDLEIVKELRKLRPDVDVTWLADDPARMILEEAGENIAPEAAQVSYGTRRAEAALNGFSANLVMVGVGMIKDAPANAEACRKVIQREKIDLVVGDEAYDIPVTMMKDPNLLGGVPLAFIYDFLGFDAMTPSLRERFYAYYANRIWHGAMTRDDPPIIARKMFVGEPEDILDKKWGPFMPSRQETGKSLDYLGYILRFDPTAYLDTAKAKRDLGYGPEPLIICTIGGTAVGKQLLDRCAEAFPIIRRSIPSAQMVLVGGPRLDPAGIEAPEGVKVQGYVPELYKHLAACDIAVILAGGTTSLELMALGKPFIYMPLEGHFEQINDVCESNKRKGANLMMRFPQTTPFGLAKAIVDNIGTRPDYKPCGLDGAKKAAVILNEMLEGRTK